MELRQYWNIVRRRGWIVLVMVVVVLAVSLLTRPTRSPSYVATMRFMVGLEPEAKTGDYYTYDRYYTWLTAEYLVDDVSELVRSGAFAQAVSEDLASAGIKVPAGPIQGSTQAGKLHRILTVSIVWGDAQQLALIANSAARLLPLEIGRHFAQVGAGGAHASLIDSPAVGGVGQSLRDKMDLPIRLALAVAAGLALILLLDYLDDTVRDQSELEAGGLAVLAQVPAPRRRGRAP